MSVLIAGLCYEIPFGCPKRKAIAVALADHASHDGSKVFPSIALIAKKVEFSERTVQRTLRELEALGVLMVVCPGGSGPKSTREWAFDLNLLRELAAGDAVIQKKGDSLSPLEVVKKGDSLSPLETVRVTDQTPKGDSCASKGDTPVTRTFTNHQIIKKTAHFTSESRPARDRLERQPVDDESAEKRSVSSIKPGLIKRAFSIGLDVTAIEAEAHQVWPTKPDRAFLAICRKQICDRLPKIEIGLITAAMDGEPTAVSRVAAEMQRTEASR